MMSTMPFRRDRSTRRGAALLLVLIALAVGLLLVATWLDGRRESVPVAQRVAANAMARMAAAGGADLAVATIDAETDWRSAMDDGRFDAAFVMATATCSLRIVDAETDAEPSDDTVSLRIVCTADVDDVTVSVERTIDVDASTPTVDLGLGETAIVVEHELRIRDESALLPWTARPGNDEGPLVVGSLDGRADAVFVEDAAVALGTEMLFVDDRSAPGSFAGWRQLPDVLPAIVPPTVPAPDLERATADRSVVELGSVPETDMLSGQVRVPARTTLAFDGDRVIRSLSGIEIADGAMIEVTRGTLVLDAAEDLIIRSATISVADGANLVLRAGREMRLHDATIVPEAVSPADAAGEFPSTSVPRDTLVATLDGSSGSIVVEGRSAVVMSIVAPGGTVMIRDDAVLHGRILAADVELGGHALVYARPDDGQMIGLTSPIGPHREDDGLLIAELASADLGSPSAMLAAADRIGLPVVLLAERVEPDPEIVARRGEEIRERVRRSLDERRRRRNGPRWAWADRERDE